MKTEEIEFTIDQAIPENPDEDRTLMVTITATHKATGLKAVAQRPVRRFTKDFWAMRAELATELEKRLA